MQRKIDRLTQRGVDRLVEEVDRARAAGETILSRRVADGDGLYVQIPEVSWISLFWFERNRHEMGLGSARTVGLKDARASNAEIRRRLAKGINPLAERTAERAKAKLDAAKAISFRQCAEACIKAHRAGWRNDKHAAQWVTTLETYVYPVFGELPVDAVDTALVMKVLEQEVRDAPDKPGAVFWIARAATAGRTRGRIESILDWAKVRGFRDGENPARWRGHLDKLLPARAKVREVKHHAALPYTELPDFMTELRKQEGVAARALEFAILTVGRTGGALGARWSEIDLAARLWTVPASRMKARKEHRVPLSARAIAILENMKHLGEAYAVGKQGVGQRYVFPGAKRGRPLSNMAFLTLLRRMNRDDLTAHGFRSTFRDWAAERTNFPSAVAEMALAHTVSSAVEKAYRRGDLFERRRRMMAAWSDYCLTDKTVDKVVQIPAKSA